MIGECEGYKDYPVKLDETGFCKYCHRKHVERCRQVAQDRRSGVFRKKTGDGSHA